MSALIIRVARVCFTGSGCDEINYVKIFAKLMLGKYCGLIRECTIFSSTFKPSAFPFVPPIASTTFD